MAPILTRVGQAFGFGASSGGGGASGSPPIEASGGNYVTNFNDGTDDYRAHIFTSSGALTVETAAADSVLEFLIVGGGGAGASCPPGGGGRGGGGAGGLRTNVPGVVDGPGASLTMSTVVPMSPTGGNGSGVYNVVVGGGGMKKWNDQEAFEGESSSLVCTPTLTVTATGGGGGCQGPPGPAPTDWGGGSGGGMHNSGSIPPAGAGNKGGPVGGAPEGNYGAPGDGQSSGGGGGAGRIGGPSPETPGTLDGGDGVRVKMLGGPTERQQFGYNGPILTPWPGRSGGWFAGGGGGAKYPAGSSGAGVGGGGGGGTANLPGREYSEWGLDNTGGGGGGGVQTVESGSGGSGIVIIRYKITGSASVKTAKATGGMVEFYNGKTIHIFSENSSTVSGIYNYTLDLPGSFDETIEYVCVGGGGSGGSCPDGGRGGGGGGAGGYLTGTASIQGPMPLAISVGRGGYSQFKKGGGFNGDPGGTGGNYGMPSTITCPTFKVGAGGGGRGGGGGPGGGEGGGAGQSGPPAQTTSERYGSGGGGGGNPGGGGAAGGTTGSGGNNPGGAAPTDGGGGGGGAGAAGGAGGVPGPGYNGGQGGLGIQVPATFRNPKGWQGFEGPGPSMWWVAGGGSGAPYGNPSGPDSMGGGGAPRGTSWCGGGVAIHAWPGPDIPAAHKIRQPARPGSGGGGGGATGGPNQQHLSGWGSPGIILIAYPT